MYSGTELEPFLLVDPTGAAYEEERPAEKITERKNKVIEQNQKKIMTLERVTTPLHQILKPQTPRPLVHRESRDRYNRPLDTPWYNKAESFPHLCLCFVVPLAIVVRVFCPAG